MKYLIFFIILIILVTGCGPSRRTADVLQDECSPSGLTISANSGKLSLKWDTNCPKEKLISGYYVYLETKPIDEQYLSTLPPRKVEPFNLAPYPGDTDVETRFETMDINNLENGIDYYVSVRTAFPDRSVSPSSNQVKAMCRPEGTFELAFRYAAQNDGFSFANGETVRADGEPNDLYFFSKDGVDYIASPSRLNGFLRKSEFYSLGKTDNIYQYPDLDLDYKTVEKMPVMVGQSYLIKTADNCYAKLRIESMTGESKQRVAKIQYIYQTRKGTMRF